MQVGTLARNRKRRWDTLTPRGQTNRGRQERKWMWSDTEEMPTWSIHSGKDGWLSDVRKKHRSHQNL